MVTRRTEAGVLPTSRKTHAAVLSPRVLLADDHRPMLDRVSMLLANDFTVVGAVTDGDQVEEAVAILRPDVLVLDISMPRVGGLEAAGRVRRAGGRVPIVCLSVYEEIDYLNAALAAGVQAYVTKSSMANDLVPAIRAALDGRGFVSAAVTL